MLIRSNDQMIDIENGMSLSIDRGGRQVCALEVIGENPIAIQSFVKLSDTLSAGRRRVEPSRGEAS